jgi:hypothetical protein
MTAAFWYLNVCLRERYGQSSINRSFGAFGGLPAKAVRLKAMLEASYGPAVILSFKRRHGPFYRLLVGHESSEGAARDLADKVRLKM